MKNEIFVHTHKGSYVGGEVIHGTVFLCIHHSIPARSVKLILAGYEKVFFQEQKTEFYDQDDGTRGTRVVTVDRSGEHTFFKVHIDLVNYPGGFPMGQFQYPFSYQLPTSLPGVFRHHAHGAHGEVKCKVEYKIKAIVDIPHGKDLQCKQHIVIHEAIDRNIAPRHFIKDHTVKTLCCIPRGDIHCEAYMDKNAYQSGETAQVHVQVNNQSNVRVSHFNTKLIREIVLSTHHGHHRTIREVISSARYEGTPEQSSRSSDCPLPLVANGSWVQPSSNGKHLKARYEVLIELDIPWAPDLEIYAPVVMYAPQPVDWAQFQAPAWAAAAQVQNTVSIGGAPAPAYGGAPPTVAPQAWAAPPTETAALLSHQ